MTVLKLLPLLFLRPRGITFYRPTLKGTSSLVSPRLSYEDLRMSYKVFVDLSSLVRPNPSYIYQNGDMIT